MAKPSHSVKGGGARGGRGSRQGCEEEKPTLAATSRECTPGRNRAAAATDPPTPTGDEKGRESERTAPESRCGASRPPREREGER